MYKKGNKTQLNEGYNKVTPTSFALNFQQDIQHYKIAEHSAENLNWCHDYKQ